MEIWKDVVGYEGYYQVSNMGNVRSVDRYVPHKNFGQKFCKGGLMATHITNSGYVSVNLCKNNRYKSYDIHRLVALAFIGFCGSKMEVNHKDENKQNNAVENLEWVTREQNEAYGTKRERHKEKIKLPILQYDTYGNFIREWPSATDAEMSISGKFTGAISHNINGKTKTAYGYVWEFKEVT